MAIWRGRCWGFAARRSARRVWCLCMHRPARCLQTTLPDVSDIGQDEQYLPICSSPAGAIVWMRETYIERSTRCLGRSVLRGTCDSRGPRLHDMRHRFATKTLVQWYRSGQDPERRLPLLSTYLGHVHVSDTQWYLEGSPELMREAMQRLQQRWEDRP